MDNFQTVVVRTDDKISIQILKITNVKERKISNEEGERGKSVWLHKLRSEIDL